MKTLYLLGIILFFLTGCKSGKSVNLFSIEDDKKLGAQVASQIESDTSGYIILDSAKNAKVYQYIYGIRNELLNS
ncbi:MAG TPA: peptidase M48, partial [Crocinitomicaceae bacterium]|nr:peptidase M48 [Crocinitomicaceae bacterium]